MIWRCGNRSFDLSRRVLVMGVLNVTPDSFSDGGRFFDPERASMRGREMARQGADIIDIGGESSRPGAEPVAAEEQIRRTEPVIRALRSEVGAAISIDTSSAAVARAALAAGADIINDITALRGDPGMIDVLAGSEAGVALMHMRGAPRTMQDDPRYDDVVGETIAFLRERGAWAADRGIHPERIVYDPGIGFGKTLEHNVEIFRRMEEFRELGRPILCGPSRKRFLRKILAGPSGMEPEADDPSVIDATAAAVAISIIRGASIVRVHDVDKMAPVAAAARALI